jgi:hypothetical protein
MYMFAIAAATAAAVLVTREALQHQFLTMQCSVLLVTRLYTS